MKRQTHPMDHRDQHLYHNLRKVQTGRISRAAGITRCPDCRIAFIRDNSTPVPYCRECRPNHSVQCRTCGTSFDGDHDGNAYCLCCRNQDALF